MTTPLNVREPRVSTLYGESLLLKPRAVSVRQQQKTFLQLHLLNDDGKNVDLEAYGFPVTPAASASSSSSSSSGSAEGAPGGTEPTLKARYYEASLCDRTTYEVDVELLESKTGHIKAFIPTQVSSTPGIYLGDIGVFDADGQLVFDNCCYVYCERSGWGDPAGPPGPMLLRYIRQSLAEADAMQSLLREEFVYDLADICYAATRAVQFWNDQPPPVSNAVYSTQAFPFPEIWLTGTQLFLLEAAEEWYRRNKLAYNAGGTQVDDLNRDREYKAAWQERFQEWRRKVMHKKAELNVKNAYRTHRSGYDIGQVSAIRGARGRF